jgi:hypothetical protein
MLASQWNRFVQNGEIQMNTLVRVEEFDLQIVQGRSIIIVIRLSVVESNADQIGFPTDIREAADVPVVIPDDL